MGIFHSFPFTSPEEFISVREPDERQREIGMIRSLSEELEGEQAEALRRQLAMRYFIPKIKKIYQIKEEYGYCLLYTSRCV